MVRLGRSLFGARASVTAPDLDSLAEAGTSRGHPHLGDALAVRLDDQSPKGHCERIHQHGLDGCLNGDWNVDCCPPKPSNKRA